MTHHVLKGLKINGIMSDLVLSQNNLFQGCMMYPWISMFDQVSIVFVWHNSQTLHNYQCMLKAMTCIFCYEIVCVLTGVKDGLSSFSFNSITTKHIIVVQIKPSFVAFYCQNTWRTCVVERTLCLLPLCR